MSDIEKAKRLLEDAMDGKAGEDEIAKALGGLGADEDLMSRLGIGSGMRTAGALDWIFWKCGGNKALLIGVIALLVSSSRLFGYTVRKGDTLWGIARASKCDLDEVRRLNPQIDGDVIHPGDKVVVPSEVSGNAAAPAGKYVVVKGDTLWGIARKFGISVDELGMMNPQVTDRDALSIGDELNVPAGSGEAAEDAKKDESRTDVVDPKTDYIAKVLYSETSICTDEEVRLVCRVILNRIGNRAFGNFSDAYGVVSQKKAFSCTFGNDGNKNWQEYRRDLNKRTMRDYGYAKMLADGDGSAFPESDVVYYCNKSLAKKYAGPGEEYGYPPGWKSKTWLPVLEKVTEHFCFYAIRKK